MDTSNVSPRQGKALSGRYYKKAISDGIYAMNDSPIVMLFSTRGMGRTSIIDAFVSKSLNNKHAVEYADISGVGYETAITRIEQLCEHCTVPVLQERRALVLNGLEVGDDDYQERVVDALRIAHESGAIIVVGTTPENEMLLDHMEDVVTFWPCDMCLDSPRISETRRFLLLTHGIPALAVEYDKLRGGVLTQPFTSPCYVDAYVSCVRSSMRESLTREERLATSVMLLLGSGTRSEVANVIGHLDDYTWNSFARCEPMLGVREESSSFAVVAHDRRGAVEVTIAAMTGSSSLWEPLVPLIVDVLMERNDYGRAAQVATTCRDAYLRCRLVLANYVPFLNDGGAHAVREACLTAQSEGFETVAGYYECASALSSLFFVTRYEGWRQREQFYASNARGRFAELCLATREIMRGNVREDALVERSRDDDVARALLIHARVLALIARGSLTGAQVLSVDSDVSLGTGTVLSVLVRLDRALCSLMSGTTLSVEERQMLRAGEELLERCGLTTLIDVNKSLVLLARVLAGRGRGAVELADAAQAALNRGDELLGALLTLGVGVCDLRNHALRRGRIRVGVACNRFAKLGLAWWRTCARLIELAARAEEGARAEEADLASCRGCTEELDSIVDALACALSGEESASTRESLASASALTDALWVVNVLTHDVGRVSVRLRACLGPRWLAAMGRVEEAGVNELSFTARGAQDGGQSAFEEYAGMRPITIQALGGLDVRAFGRIVPRSSLTRRKGISLLAALVAASGHSMRRYDVKESILCDSTDPQEWAKYVGAAATTVRSAFMEAGGDSYLREAVVADKATGKLKLTEELVACDVDLFEACATQVQTTTDDLTVVRLARDAEELYRGDLFLPPDDYAHVCTIRQESLRKLFVDVMMRGSKSAVKVEQHVLAIRFATRACKLVPMNEDLVGVLVEALYKSGRRSEARDTYFAFSARLARDGKLVSDGLRKAMVPFVEERDTGELLALGERRPGMSITISDERRYRTDADGNVFAEED